MRLLMRVNGKHATMVACATRSWRVSVMRTTYHPVIRDCARTYGMNGRVTLSSGGQYKGLDFINLVT
jgi:hypothetical protein